MPRSLLWTRLANGFSRKMPTRLLEALKASKITKSVPVTCTVCSTGAPHNIRYRLQRCSCRACAEESTYLKCPWRAKTLHCESADLVDILETGTHVTEMRSVPKPRLTSEMKVFAQEMTAQGLKPVRIRNAILRRFNLAPEELPPLTTIQRFCNTMRARSLTAMTI
ncbi:hypothetical protein GQ600_18189 [Phytophthora cactorum]|nr:hypothetical protein GQ600_18189 [Phytophthora cactorum]